MAGRTDADLLGDLVGQRTDLALLAAGRGGEEELVVILLFELGVFRRGGAGAICGNTTKRKAPSGLDS